MQFGSDSKRIIPQAVNGILDDSGNVVVSGDTSFGASPLGSAARSQALYGIANANFNLTPNIPENPIVDGSNPLPFWSADDLSEGRITAKMFYNETDQTFAVELNPTAGSASDAFTLTTRSYLLNDSGISLRQKAYATLTKVNSYSSTNQWNLTLSATYYDAAGVSLSSFSIGTAADNVAFTGINGFTTSGTAIVSASAQYVDLAFTLTCALAVTSTVKVQIENILLQTSTGGGGTSSFIIADTFSTSGSWVRPASVNYLIGVVVAGAGGGGGGGGLFTDNATFSGRASGGGGGGSSRWTFMPNLYVGNQGTVTVGIGAGGAGGTARTFSKVAASATTASLIGGNGAAGGATTFGSFISVPGGGGGNGGSVTNDSATGGTAGGTVTTLVYGIDNLPGTAGGTGTSGTATATTQGFSTFPYVQTYAGGTGGSATGTGIGVTTTAGGAGGSAGVCGSGGGARIIGYSVYPGTSFAGGWGNGGGGGGATHFQMAFGSNPTTGTAGNGGSGSVGNSAGGGGGGPCFLSNGNNYTSCAMTLASGAGGTGSGGFVAVIYVA